ncbi:MAG: D-glycero-beta-D-manno-heptose-7-phosphate kinase [Candidatus Marinimicrobia bacterium]|nr:D-glycero-beta-D-manno-heptose-7-phosphate kinase [Candidatus Neomarinimicrobiota bacterium]
MLLERFFELRDAFAHLKVAVLGDVMLDTYVWGTVSRISPEAPVPVVAVDRIEHRPGGAANVAFNLQSLGARVELVGLIGDDASGRMFEETVSGYGLEHKCVVDSERPTTEKTRVIAGSQHIIRMDKEVIRPPSARLEAQLVDASLQALEGADALILQDYHKGVFSPEVIRRVCAGAARAGCPVFVDPKIDHIEYYKQVALIKPNEQEAAHFSGRPIGDDDDVRAAGSILRERLQAEVVLITRGANGMDLCDADGYHRIPTKARKVADVCGAGDTVISTYTLSILAGATVLEAATLSNYAAGTVVEEMGVVPVKLEKLEGLLRHYAPG